MRRFRDNGAAHILRILKRHELTTVYSIPGAQVLSLWDAAYADETVQLIVPRSEWDGVRSAVDYARENHRAAVVLNTVGVGVVNELPELSRALDEGVPVFCLSPAQPEFKRERIDGVFQGLRQSEILRPFCKATFLIEALDDAEAMIAEAIAIMYAERAGPVRVEVEFPLLFQ